MHRLLVSLLALVSFTGCTTHQPLADAQPATVQQQVQAGDKVEIERLDGSGGGSDGGGPGY